MLSFKRAFKFIFCLTLVVGLVKVGYSEQNQGLSDSGGLMSSSQSGELSFTLPYGGLKIPFFVRGKARRNTEKFAEEHGLSTIEVDTLYDAKAHFSN